MKQKTTAKGKGNGGARKGKGKVVLAFQDGSFNVRPKIGHGEIFSCINLEIDSHGQNVNDNRQHQEAEITFSYHQALVLADILRNFVDSRESHRKVQTPVFVSRMGEVRWSTFPYMP